MTAGMSQQACSRSVRGAISPSDKPEADLGSTPKWSAGGAETVGLVYIKLLLHVFRDWQTFLHTIQRKYSNVPEIIRNTTMAI